VSLKHQSYTDSKSLYDYAIALTGGISTGKSSVAEIFTALGYDIIDADKISHEILDEQHSAISEEFGEDYVRDGKVVRKKLGALIFGDESAKDFLEKLLHPLIRDKIEQVAALLDEKKKSYLIDLPLFYETNRYNIDDVIVVYVPKDTQLERLMSRDGSSREDALARIDSQIDIELKRQKATYVIDNSGSRDELLNSCREIDIIIKNKER